MAAFVLATDGLFYRDPVISGPGWYVVFDGYDDPEIVIDSVGMTPTDARLSALSILDQIGLSAILSGAPRIVERSFDKDGIDKRMAFCFWLEVTAALPRDALPVESRGFSQPSGVEGDAMVMTFGGCWG